MRYILSTDGGTTFLPSTQIGNNNTGDFDLVLICGLAGKGDTIVASWTYRLPSPYYSVGSTYYAITTDGGVSWLPMGTSHSGSDGSYISDAVIAPDNEIFIATCHYGTSRNIEMMSSTNLGTNWIVNTPITNESGNNSNDYLHLTKFNSNFYSVWTHDNLYGYVDRLYFSKSTDDGGSWQPRVRINDPDNIANCTQLGVSVLGHPNLAFSPSGTIYAVWSDSRERHMLLYDSALFNVYISRSTDDGDTWSTVLKVSEPSDISMIANWYPCVVIKSDGVTDSVLVSWSKVRYTGPSNEGICEEFNSETFPPPGWNLFFTGTQYWSRNTASAYGFGSGSAKFEYWFAEAGTEQSLIINELSPTLAGDTLFFDNAYAGFNVAGYTDSLIIETSSNGGITYSELVSLW